MIQRILNGAPPLTWHSRVVPLVQSVNLPQSRRSTKVRFPFVFFTSELAPTLFQRQTGHSHFAPSKNLLLNRKSTKVCFSRCLDTHIRDLTAEELERHKEARRTAESATDAKTKGRNAAACSLSRSTVHRTGNRTAAEPQRPAGLDPYKGFARVYRGACP